MTQGKTIWENLKPDEEEKLESISSGYIDFLCKVKTEGEAVDYFMEQLTKDGFQDLEKLDKLTPGTRFYYNHIGRTFAAGIVGRKGLDNGLYIIASHIDSPRLDLKPRPLYEDSETNTALLKTQYYGGVKKYQWVNIPLALHGRIFTKDGRVIKVNLGEDEKDPVLLIPDLLPHISKMQRDRKLFDGIAAEELNAVAGSRPGDYKEEKFKSHILKLLKERYNVEEEDLASADLALVPAGKAREGGFDSSLVIGYGHDDKASAYTSFRAFQEISEPEDTALVLFFDKEEIGSQGTSGSQSNFLEYVATSLLHKLTGKSDNYHVLSLLRKSNVISSDVDAAMDPSFKEAHDAHNAAKLGAGIVVAKYSGYGGKFEGSEAPGEFVAYVRKIFEKHNVPYQFGTLGKVDEGGGGTVAQDFAKHGMNVVDAGAPVLGMHAPYEITSKADLYSCFKAYKAFMLH